MMFFGSAWPRDEWRVFVPTPPMVCLYCDQPIAPRDSGVVMPYVGEAGAISMCAYHRACLLTSCGVLDAVARGDK